ncbi:perlucin-like isoform X1 [Mytilus edulis]|uniref:perlucin-like isoform X1 n=1 Tax=Mytilus edulis TaxID=6550 RepID=UPI0039F07FF4
MNEIVKLSLYVFFQIYFFTVFCNCPSGWSRHDQSCYHVSRDSASWAEAMKMCEIHGSFLASIETVAEDQYMKTLLGAQRHTSSFWLGGSDWDNEGEWKWEPHAIQMKFTNWHKGQPDNSGGKEHCLSVHRSYRYEFVDNNCHDSQHYLCEKPDTNSTETEVLGK